MCAVADQQGSFRDRLPQALAGLEPAERPRCQAWCYGLARYHVALSARLQQLMQKPLKARDADLAWLLQLGLYQLEHSDVPAPLVVSETVEAVEQLDKSWARGFINAVLRRAVREREAGAEPEPATDAQRYAFPEWLYQRLLSDWGDRAPDIAQASNEQAAMCLRVAGGAANLETVEAEFDAAGMPTRRGTRATAALLLETAVDVESLPGFAAGAVSVQDESAQLAVELLAAVTPEGARLLDACAAPGGKTAHALDSGRFGPIVALDQSASRLARVQQTLDRLGRSDAASLVVADAAELDDWWDGKSFTAVLLDAPCSGSGVIRRHPDIKLLRDEEDVEALVKTQARLLDAAWKVLAPGGHLLYTTCSVFKSENEDQVACFIERHPDAQVCAIDSLAGQARPDSGPILGRQWISDSSQAGDGFWYSLLTRLAD